MFFAISDRLGPAHLADTNIELAVTYTVVRDSPEKLIERLDAHAAEHAKSPRDYFESVRALNAGEEQCGPVMRDPVAVAARFVYLNRCCYNGLYRVNKSGRFNAPWNKQDQFKFCAETIRAAAGALSNTKVTAQDFRKASPNSGDFVYCDPPYDKTYNQYSADRFDDDEQRALAKLVRTWAEAGVRVMVSNSDTAFVRGLYSMGFHIHEVAAPRPLNRDGEARGPVSDLVLTSYEI
ncbi:MAG TPA: DNA methyltransferase [Acidimicrobiaceae bacterium]|nr:DNA methyltransferase [Acidimicrobiaceae bacterium]